MIIKNHLFIKTNNILKVLHLFFQRNFNPKNAIAPPLFKVFGKIFIEVRLQILMIY